MALTKRFAVVLAAVMILAIAAAPRAGESRADTEDDAAKDTWQDRIKVTAEITGGQAVPLGGSATVIDPDRSGDPPSSLTSLVDQVPGVSRNGQGGLLQVFSIRGVSRQRVASLIAGVRVTSERRAGAATSFVDPLLMESVQVVRGPATTYYGSGALGGAVQVTPRRFEGWEIRTGYDTDGNENYLAAGFGTGGWSLGVARRDAADSESADGTPINSHFTQYSAVLQRAWDRGPRRYELLAVPTLAEDVGKANSDFPDPATNYPRERHQLVRFAVASEKSWRAEVFAHAHDLETEVVDPGVQRSLVRNDALDYGMRWEQRLGTARRLEMKVGLDAFGRRGVDAEELRRTVSPPASETLNSLDDANSLEAGLYAIARRAWGATELEAGARLARQRQDNAGFAAERRTAWSGHLGLARPLGRGFELLAALNSGTRFPSLSELFFTGTTGRGDDVAGNPALDSERALSAEVSIRRLGPNALVAATLFRNEIDDYIERVDVAPDLRSFVNLTSGELTGIELQGFFRGGPIWSVNWGAHRIRGEADDGRTLADSPPDEIYLGATRERAAWRVDARLTWRGDKDDFGSGEQPIPSAWLLGGSVRYRVSPTWRLSLSVSNLLDEDYFASADDKAPRAPGRSAAFGLVWSPG